MSGIVKQALVCEVWQKSTFTGIGFLMISGSIFHDLFGVASGPIFMTFVALETTGLKFDYFSAWGHPRSKASAWWVVNWFIPRP